MTQNKNMGIPLAATPENTPPALANQLMLMLIAYVIKQGGTFVVSKADVEEAAGYGMKIDAKGPNVTAMVFRRKAGS